MNGGVAYYLLIMWLNNRIVVVAAAAARVLVVVVLGVVVVVRVEQLEKWDVVLLNVVCIYASGPASYSGTQYVHTGVYGLVILPHTHTLFPSKQC